MKKKIDLQGLCYSHSEFVSQADERSMGISKEKYHHKKTNC